MWLPGPVYESLPYAYIVGGVLFISGTLYLGLDAPGAALYIICGLISIVSGVVVFGWRQAHRQKSSKPGDTSVA
jgi:uncharacterized membrane protein